MSARGRQRLGSALAALVASLACLAFAAGALAAEPVPASSLVVVARPENTDAIAGEALARVSGELVAAGFDVEVVPVPPDADPRTTVETVGRELSPAAAFAIFPGAPAPDGTPTAEIWVADRITARAAVERMRVDPRSSDRGAAALAVHAVELLKASAAELWVPETARARPPAPPPEPPVVVAPPRAPADGHDEAPVEPAPARASLGVEAAMAVVEHVGGFGADLCPALRVSIGIAPGFEARAGALGLGRAMSLSSSDGTATVHQQLLTLDVLRTFRAGRRLQPFVALSAGAFHLDIDGMAANAPWIDRRTGTWDAVAGGAGGAALALSKHAALTAELHALFFWNRPLVPVGDGGGNQAGLPMLVASAGLRLSL